MDYNEQTTSTFQVGMKYGLILGFATLLTIVFLYYTGLQDFYAPDNLWLPSVLSLAILVFIIYLGLKEFRELNDGLLSLGDSMIITLYIGLISGLVGSLLTIGFYHFIDPEIYSRMVDFMADMTVSNEHSNADLDEIQEAKSAFSFLFSPASIFISNLISSVITSALIGLICGLVMRTD